MDLHPIEMLTAVYLNEMSGRLRDHKINRSKAVEIIIAAVEIVALSPKTQDLERGVNGMFDEDIKELTCDRLYSMYRDNFEYGRHALKNGFKDLTLNKVSSLPRYDGSQASTLDPIVLALMRMATNKMDGIKELQPMYNSSKSGSSFNRLANALVGYSAPSFLLIRHSYKTTDEQTHKGIIGAIVDCEWKDELGYWGTTNTCILTLLPRIKFMYAYKGKGGNSFVYLNTRKISNSKYGCGLGFGGSQFKDYRIWLDDELLDKSKTTGYDDTFPLGTMSDGYDEHLKVDCP